MYKLMQFSLCHSSGKILFFHLFIRMALPVDPVMTVSINPLDEELKYYSKIAKAQDKRSE